MKKIITMFSLLVSASSSFADSAWPLTQAMELQADTPVNRLQILGAHKSIGGQEKTTSTLQTRPKFLRILSV